MTTVLLVDDEESARADFASRHRNSGWYVSTYDGALRDLPKWLEDKKRSQLPDLLVLDLYTTKEPPGTPGAEQVNKAVEGKIQEIDKLVAELRDIVDSGKEPVGLELLKQVRASPTRAVRQLPVMLFTRQGLALLSDEELKISHEKDATWMLKNRTPELERAAMQHALARKASLARDVKINALFCILGLLLSPFITKMIDGVLKWLQ